METRPTCKSFHYISASKNINFIINNNDENKDDHTIANVDSSNSKDNADNPVILQMHIQLFSTGNQVFYIPRLNLNKIKQRFSPTSFLNRIFQKSEYISLKVHSRRFKNLSICSNSYKYNILKVFYP